MRKRTITSAASALFLPKTPWPFTAEGWPCSLQRAGLPPGIRRLYVGLGLQGLETVHAGVGCTAAGSARAPMRAPGCTQHSTGPSPLKGCLGCGVRLCSATQSHPTLL